MPWLSISALEVQSEKHSFRRSEVRNIPNKPVNLQGRATVKQGISKEEPGGATVPISILWAKFHYFQKNGRDVFYFRLQKL